MRLLFLVLIVTLQVCCSSQNSTVVSTADNSAAGLARVALGDDADKRDSAIKQLRQLAASRQIDQKVLASLIACDASDAAAMELDQILATGGPHIDSLLLQEFNKNGSCAAAMGLVRQPSSEVTQTLLQMASSPQEQESKKRICMVILVARGDTRWMDPIISNLRATPRSGSHQEIEDYAEFVGTLVAIAPKLPHSAKLEDTLWMCLWESNLGEGEDYLNALMALARAHPDFSAQAQAPQLRLWLTKNFNAEADAFLIHIIFAGLNIDTPAETRKALSALGTPGWGIATDKKRLFVEQRLAPWLERKDILQAIREELTSKDERVMLGALRTIIALGPDASDMRSHIEPLISHPDPQVQETARDALRRAAGVDAHGQWPGQPPSPLPPSSAAP